jgi:hypothetical protein
MDGQRIVRLTVVVAVAAIYVSTRFWNLTTSCLWFDEIFSVHAAEHGWDLILNFVALDLIHPPLFYVLLKLWIAAGGESLLWLRTLPVILSLLAIPPFLLLCRELRLGFWTTVLALFLIAVNGSLIKYSQEVRMYSMLMCASLASIWLFARSQRTGNGSVFLTLANVPLVYTHYFGWLVIAAEIIALFTLQRSKWRMLVSIAVIPAISFLPWFVAIVTAARSGSELGQNIGWMHPPVVADIVSIMLNIVEPFYYPAISIEPTSIFIISIPLLLVALVSIGSYFARKERSENRTTALLLLIFIVVPIVAAFLVSWISPYSVWGTRHLVIVFVPSAMMFAMSTLVVDKLRTVLLAATLILVGVASVLQFRRPQTEAIWCGFEPLTMKMEGDSNLPVIVFEDMTAYHIWFALRNGDVLNRPPVIKISHFPGMAEDNAYFLPRGFDGVRTVNADETLPDQILVVYRASGTDDQDQPLAEFAKRGYGQVSRETVDFGYQKLYGVVLKRVEVP